MNRKSNKPRKTRSLVLHKKCGYCGCDFRPQSNSSIAKYCSKKCFGLGTRTVPARSCLNCNMEFRPPSNCGYGKYCNSECYNNHSRTIPDTNCGTCGVTFRPNKNRDKVRYCSKKCAWVSISGKSENYTHRGYEYTLAQDHKSADRSGYVPTHRLVVEDSMGISIEFGETCHHINSIKKDNHPNNLMVLSRSAHGKIHGWLRKQLMLKKYGNISDNVTVASKNEPI